MAPQSVLQPVLPFDIGQASSLRKFQCFNCIFSFSFIHGVSVSFLHTYSFVLSYKEPTLKLCSNKALWILKVTFFSWMNTSFLLTHLLFLQTQSITDDINYVNIQRVLSTSSGFSNMLICEMHLKCREGGRSWVLLHWKRENNFLCAIPGLQGMMSFSKLLIVLLPRL